MSPLVVGIDLSLKATGVAWWDTAPPVDPVPLLLLETIQSGKTDGLRRLQSIRSQVSARVRAAELVVLEGLYPQAKANAYTNERAGLWYLIADRLDQLGVRYAVVQPTAVKQYATGKGNASKTAVVAAVVRRYDASPADDDQADALVLAAMGLHHLGCPPAPVPAAHERALKAVTWP